MRTDPISCVTWLNTRTYHAPLEVSFVHHNERVTVFEIESEPPVGFDDYPRERARIVTVDGVRSPLAVPCDRDRPWLHVNPRIPVKDIPIHRPCPFELLLGSLCLWDPKDPMALQWTWQKGIGEFIAVAQRHLFYEEYWRQEGHWPVEDSPHGPPADGRRHPMVTPVTRSAVA